RWSSAGLWPDRRRVARFRSSDRRWRRDRRQCHRAERHSLWPYWHHPCRQRQAAEGGAVEGDIFHKSLSIDESSLFEGSSRRVENPTDLSSSVDAKVTYFRIGARRGRLIRRRVCDRARLSPKAAQWRSP